jgi:hypothetical protein
VFYDSFSVWLVTLSLILRKIIERAIARDILRRTNLLRQFGCENRMAKLPDATIAIVLNLQRPLLERIDEATKAGFMLRADYSETEETIPELDELQSIRERADSYYTRFYITLRRIYEAQPIAHSDSLKLVTKYIEDAEVTIEVIQASIQDIRRNWNLSCVMSVKFPMLIPERIL